jgi:hypothetical protein
MSERIAMHDPGAVVSLGTTRPVLVSFTAVRVVGRVLDNAHRDPSTRSAMLA